MSFSQRHCPECNSQNFKRHTGYILKNGETREIYYCWECDSYFSETKNTPLARLKTPISRMALILEAINDGLGLNAACRTFQVSKNSLKRWISRLGDLKETLLLYALCHQFIQQMVEGDERLDAYWVLHNFIRPHFTTKQVPAVALGIVDHPLSWEEIFRIQYIRPGYT